MGAEPLYGWLQRAVRERPHEALLITDTETLDALAVQHRLGTLAARCRAAGLIGGRTLAVQSADNRQLAWGALLAMYAGCPFLPLSPAQEAAPLLAAAGGARWFAADAGAAAGPAPWPLDWLDAPADEAPAAAAPLPAAAVQLYVASSGSGGAPRLVKHTGAGLAAAVGASRRRTGLGPGDLWLGCLPLAHIGGLAILLRCLHAGATLRLLERFDAGRVHDELYARPVTHLSLVPAMLARLLEQDDAPPPATLRCVLVGGGPLSAAVAEPALARGWPLCPVYGMTETASHVTFCNARRDGWSEGDVGVALDGCHIDVVDAQGRPVQGEGLIRIRGPMLMAGYAGDAGPGDGLRDGAFVSRDIGRLDADGRLHLAGRADHLIVSGGVNLDPERLEARLAACPGVDAVAVTGIADPEWGQRVAALLSGPVEPDAFLAWCREHIDSAQRPRLVFKTEHLPATALGKPDRPAIARLARRLHPSPGDQGRLRP